MKIRFFVYLWICAGFCSCAKDDIQTVDFFEPLSVDTVFYSYTNGVQSVVLKASGEVTVEVPEEARPWCSAEITGTGGGQAVIVHCSDYGRAEARYATLVLKTSQATRNLVVCQYGTAPIIKVIQGSYELSADSVLLSVPVISTVDYRVAPAEKWIHYTGTVKGGNADTLKLALGASGFLRRSGNVVLQSEAVTAFFSITQVSADSVYQPGNVAYPAGKIKIVGGTTNYDGRSEVFAFVKSYDGVPATIYYSDKIPLGEKLEMVWNFEKPEELSKLIYTPDKDGRADQTLGKFKLLVRKEGSSEFTEIGDFNLQYQQSSSSLKLPVLDKKAEAVKIIVAQPGNAQNVWYFNCQEMEFWGKAFDVTSVFTDEICSDLKEGVTYEQIMAIEDEFYRNIARYMYMGTYEKEFRVQEYKPYFNPSLQSGLHKAFAWGFLDNPTGVYVEEGDKILLMAGDTYNEDIKLGIVDWNTATSRNLHPSIPSFAVKKGLNEFIANKSGLMYILYNTYDLTGRKNIKIHIVTGKVNGYFNITRHGNGYWKSLLNNGGCKFMDVQGKLTHLVFPTDDFRAICPDNIERLVQVYDSIVLLEHQQSGLYKYSRMYPNRLLCKVTYEESAYMYATNYQTAFRNTTAPQILNAGNLRADVWGVAHELGHVHQNRDITWRGMTEVSNNVFSLFVQRMFGSESRLIAENRYQEAYDLMPVGGASHAIPGIDNPFAKVVPLWQMFLYFTEVAGKPDFNMDLYEAMREETAPRCPQLNFVELCCRVSGVDLTDFFIFYGFLMAVDTDDVKDSVNPGIYSVAQADVDATIKTIAEMDLKKKAPAIQYLTEKNMALFRAIKPVKSGSAQLSGSKLTLSGWENVVAWEVYTEENGREKLIQISLENSFTLKQTGSSVRMKAVAADGTKVKVNF